MQIINAKVAIMDIDNIKAFIAVYRAGSFVDVANERNVASSTVSRAVATLEAQLNTRLFQRTTRKLVPTQEGELYFEKISPLIEEMDLVHQSLIDSGATPSGRLRVTASVSYGQIVIAPLLKAFRTQYPNIELELILSDAHIDLINDQVDIAIRHGNLSDSNLVARKLADVRYHLVSSNAYLQQRGAPQVPDDLSDHDLVTFAYDNFRNAWNFQRDGASQRISIRPIMTATNAATIRQSVRDGMGIALLADWTIRSDLQSEKLVELLPDWQVTSMAKESAVWLVYPSKRFVPAKTRAFIEFLFNSA